MGKKATSSTTMNPATVPSNASPPPPAAVAAAQNISTNQICSQMFSPATNPGMCFSFQDLLHSVSSGVFGNNFIETQTVPNIHGDQVTFEPPTDNVVGSNNYWPD
uniref:Uncharacterized protein n=1 Tax=Arundo donax TaxID=35708 RepID=A0A0A9C228_ARUDO